MGSGTHHTSDDKKAASRPLRFVCAGGGTGGHVFPAVAIADALRKQHPDAGFLFAGARDRIEWKAVPKAGYEIRPIWISGLQRRFTLSNMLVPLKLLVSLIQSFRLLRDFRPDAVICTGGYVSGPVGWVAAKLGIPLFLQEQNSFPGVTTRLLSGDARRVFTAFEPAEKHLPKPAEAGRIRLFGNPARAALLPLYDAAQKQHLREKARQAFNIPETATVLLILGGSGGAGPVNEAVRRNLNRLHNDLGLHLIWQCGKAYIESLEQEIDRNEYPRLHLYHFIDDMAGAYASASMALSRAGAGICTELLIAGLPSLLMPSPYVAGDHQTQNAKAMTDAGAAQLLSDADAPEQLVPELERLLSDEASRQKMAHAARQLAKPEAASDIAAEVLHCLETPD